MSKKGKDKTGNSEVFRYILFAIVVIVVIAVIGVLAYKVIGPSIIKEEDPVIDLNVVEIKGYGIHLDDNDSNLYRDEYKILEENLLGKEINYEEYAKSVAKMFIIDLYTIKNKSNKYDVGGLDFLYPDAIDNFTVNVTDTIYKYVEDNTSGERTQQLPAVNAITVESIKEGKFTIESEKKEYKSYVVNLTWTYSIDLGYDTKGEVIIIKKDNKLYVVEKN